MTQGKHRKTVKRKGLEKIHPECKGLTFQECERTILQNVVDALERTQGKELLEQPSIQEIIVLLEKFLIKKERICYGGTAINNLLPKEDQFYDLEVEFPDYDFYSPSPIEDAKQLADIFARNGYANVEAKAGVHFGTYKVFVDFISVADITHMPLTLYRELKRKTYVRKRIHYVPPNFLRMSMYLELSRPNGAISRWEKVFERLNLLNKHYPLEGNDCVTQKGKLSKDITIQRVEDDTLSSSTLSAIYRTTRRILIEQGVVFFGAYAHQLYSKYMPSTLRRKTEEIPDFDVLCENIDEVSHKIKDSLNESINLSPLGKSVKIINHTAFGELLPRHVEIRVGNESVCFLYEPMACHSYNTIKIRGEPLRVATIDTMLSFYLAFIYMNRPYYDEHRLLCMSEFLFRVQERNRLAQKGVLRRFTMTCYGTQKTIRDIRAQKNKKYRELRKTMKKARKSDTERKIEDIQKEYEEWFFKYIPTQTPNARKHLSIRSLK